MTRTASDIWQKRTLFLLPIPILLIQDIAEVYVIGISEEIDGVQLEVIASDPNPDYYMTVPDFPDISRAQDLMTKAKCLKYSFGGPSAGTAHN